jgi:hypothetical protein
MATKDKSSATHAKDFFVNKCAKVLRFQGILFFFPEITVFGQ